MQYTFTAAIKKHPEKDATYIEIPFDVEQEFGAKRVKVKATFDGRTYRGSIVKMGLPCYMIGITKEIRSQIGKKAGDSVEVTLEEDQEERIVEVPETLKEALSKNKQAKEFYDTLSYSAKRKYVQWITSAKQEKTKEKRVQEAIVKLEQKQKI